MVKETYTVQTTISSRMMKTSLFKGCAIGLLGILPLLFGGIFLPLQTLKTWGFLLFLLGFGLITYGLLPYRRLCRLQLNPSALSLVDSECIEFYSKGKKILTIPLPSLAQLSYIPHSTHYGIAAWIKQPPPFPVVIHQYPEEVENLRKKGEAIEADFFFPYFNQRAYDELMDDYYAEMETENESKNLS